jgi:hypothetical protein
MNRQFVPSIVSIAGFGELAARVLEHPDRFQNPHPSLP